MEGQKKGKRRLQPEAYAILNDYFENVSQWPDPTAQEDLAERVRGVGGCEFYTVRQVYSYFANNRAKFIKTGGNDFVLPTGDAPRRGRRKASRGDLRPASSRPLSDSAQDSVTHKLNVLLDDEPDPSPEVVEVWADSLGNGVVAEHILTYAFLRRATTFRESETQAQSPEQQLEKPAAAPPQHQSSSSLNSVSLDAATHRSVPASSPHKEPAEHPAPSTVVPPAVRPANLAQLAEEHPSAVPPTPRPPSDGVRAGHENENAAGAPTSTSTSTSTLISIPPLARVAHDVGPDALVQRVRAALLEADARGTRDSPKTFVDFARWLEAHNEDRGAVLHTTAAAATTATTPRALQPA
ncbi:hypothetical protein V8D89_011040 [Ganoderma adspersum]